VAKNVVWCVCEVVSINNSENVVWCVCEIVSINSSENVVWCVCEIVSINSSENVVWCVCEIVSINSSENVVWCVCVKLWVLTIQKMFAFCINFDTHFRLFLFLQVHFAGIVTLTHVRKGTVFVYGLGLFWTCCSDCIYRNRV